MGLEPYYQDSAVTIYHGDCREILPSLGPVDLVLTDPPYGIGYVHGAEKIAHASRFNEMPVIGDDKPFDAEPLLRYIYRSDRAIKAVLWGAHNYTRLLPSSNGWLVWDKQEGGSKSMGDCELAWTNFNGAIRRLSHLWDGFNKRSERGVPRYHPTQKPIALMKWCIAQAGDGVTSIADPYCGSGPTLRAAKDLGIKAIGIEIEEKYCEIAARRMSQEVLAFT